MIIIELIKMGHEKVCHEKVNKAPAEQLFLDIISSSVAPDISDVEQEIRMWNDSNSLYCDSDSGTSTIGNWSSCALNAKRGWK